MTRRKDGIWQEVVIINGKRKYFYGKTKAAVLKKIQEFEEEQERGALFKQVAEEWWEVHEPEIAYNTTKGYKPAMNRAIAAFDDTPIKDIVPQQIAKVLSHMNDIEEKLSERLQGEEKDMFLDFCNAYAELMCDTELDSFTAGFRLGAKMMLDVFCGDDVQLESILKD